MAPVELEVLGGVAVVTLNRPEKLNSITNEDVFQIGTYLEDIAKLDDVFVTVLIGTGRFFSSGIDVTTTGNQVVAPESSRRHYLERLTSNIIRNTRAFYRHPKILITVLNGPVIGLPAALISLSDFVFAVEDAYLSMPFISLGVASEGGASVALAQRLGIAKAKEILIQGKRVSARELHQTRFVNEILPWKGDSPDFRERVLEKIRKDFALAFRENALAIKGLMQRPYLRTLDDQTTEEAFQQGQRFVDGLPQKLFREMAAKRKASKI